MEKSSRDNTFYSPSTNLVDAVIDEVALEGLDGITLEALWQRLAVRLQITDTFSQSLKEQIWTICISIKDLIFYKLNEPRPPLVIYDRYEFVDPHLGTIIEPDNLPDDIYEYFPIDDIKNGIKGSCKSYYTRKKIESMCNFSLEMAEKKYGGTLVIVGSQAARQYALIGDSVCPTLELNVTQYCFLERVGRSRYHGEVTQGKRSLSMLKEDPKSLFYYRKLLIKHRLITKQMHYQKNSGHGTSGSLLHLTRFYVERKPKVIYLAEKIIELLKKRESNLADYDEIKKELGLESSIKHLFKMAFFQRVVKTDLVVPYRTLYPDAKSSEWQRKNCPSREKRIRAVELIDPTVEINDLWIKDDGVDDEESYELDTSKQKMHEPFLRQANLIVEQANYNGLSQNELAIKMGLTKLQSRTIFRNLSKIELVATYMNDMGRQRITKYVSKKFEKNSNISKQFQEEMNKMKELAKRSVTENEYKTPSTTKEFFYPPAECNENNKNSQTPIIDEPMEIDDEHTEINRKNLFAIVNKIMKKYKVNKFGFKYRVLHQNVSNLKDLKVKLNKSSDTGNNVLRKVIKLNDPIADDSLKDKCNVVIQETEVLDNSIGDIRSSIKDFNLSGSNNTGSVTYRILKRANMIIEAVKEHKVIDDTTKLMKMINEEEEREGYDVKIDKKSLIRLLQKLAANNLVKNIKLTLSTNGTKKILTFICDPSINVNHTVIQSAVEQARIKFCLYVSNKNKPTSQPKNESKSDNKVQTCKKTVKSSTNANSKIIPTNLIVNSKAGKEYGYSPKFVRMKVMHQLLYYLIYDHPGRSNLSRERQIEELKSQGNEVDDEMEKEMCEIYDTKVSWRMFIPALPIHNGWPQGWALFCDVLLRIPLSLFLKVYHLPFHIPDLDYYIKNPIRQHYLIKDLPAPLRNALLLKRRYIFNIHETVTRLCFIGLIQFGPQKLKEKDQVFIYLNRRSELMDTTTSAMGYHKIQEKKYPITKYLFDKMQTVEQYWYDMWHICINTRLGGRLVVQGTDIILEELAKKVEMIQTLKPKLVQEATSLDLGIMPGDKRGAAGIDSAFFSHLKRNWNWENFNNTYNVTMDDNEIRYHNMQRKTHLSKVQNKPIKFTEFTGLKKVTGPLSVDINDLKELKKPQQKNVNIGEKVIRVKLIGNKSGRKQNAIVRRVLPRKRKTRCRVKYDDIDFSALQKMEKLRVDWNPREDNILLVCKVVMMYLAPNPRSQVITFTAVRDVLRLYSVNSYNKTSRACQRRLLYMLKQPQTIHSVALGVEELKQNYFVNKRYGDVVEKIRKANDPNECDEKMATVFKNLVAYVAKKYYDISQTESKEMRYKPNSVQEFNLVYEISHPQKPHSNQGFTHDVKSTNDIHTATINSVIYSSMCCGKDRKSWAYQLFRIYQQYPEILLRNAMGKIRSDQMVSINRNYVSAMKKYGNCMPMSSSQYQLSTAYMYKFHTKLPNEIFDEIQDFFSTIIESYSNENSRIRGNGINIFPPTGGMFVAIQECLVQNKLNFNVEIPDHVITLLDSKHQEYDETYIRIAKRYQDILASLKQIHTEHEQPREQIQKHLILDKDKNDDAKVIKKQSVSESKAPCESNTIAVKQPVKKSFIKREHWGWGSTKFHNQSSAVNAEENIETSNCIATNEDLNDCEYIQSQDGATIAITKDDIERSKLTTVDDSIYQAFLKTHSHLSDDFIDFNLIKKLNEITNEALPMEINMEENSVDQSELSQSDMITDIYEDGTLTIDERKESNFINDIIGNMDCEVESSPSCCKKHLQSDDIHKSCTRIALLKMREELNEDLPDSHHAQEYFVVSVFGVYYSLPEIEVELRKNPDFIIDDNVKNQILLLKDENYNRVVDDLQKFAVFPKDYPDYMKIKMDLEMQNNIPVENIDSIFDYIRNKREQGATLRELKVKFCKKIGNKLYDLLHHMMHHRLILRSGVTEMHYIHHNFIDPWIIQSIRIMRLQREGLPPIPPGSVYVFNSQQNDKNTVSNDTDNSHEIKDDEISSLKLNENNSINNSNNQKNIRKNRRTCLLQTKDIYTAAKKLDLNTAEDIHVVIRPWIQIDGIINRSMLGKMLGAVLAHCVTYPGIILTQVQTRFLPALQPYHTRELVEMLVKLQCLELKIIPKITTNLFSNPASTKLSYPERIDGSSAYDNEIIIEAAVGATLKFSTFLRRYQSNTKSSSTDSTDCI